MPIERSYKDLLDVNGYIQKLADSFYFMCTTRTVQESKLFPVNPYIVDCNLPPRRGSVAKLPMREHSLPAEAIPDTSAIT